MTALQSILLCVQASYTVQEVYGGDWKEQSRIALHSCFMGVLDKAGQECGWGGERGDGRAFWRWKKSSRRHALVSNVHRPEMYSWTLRWTLNSEQPWLWWRWCWCARPPPRDDDLDSGLCLTGRASRLLLATRHLVCTKFTSFLATSAQNSIELFSHERRAPYSPHLPLNFPATKGGRLRLDHGNTTLYIHNGASTFPKSQPMGRYCATYKLPWLEKVGYEYEFKRNYWKHIQLCRLCAISSQDWFHVNIKFKFVNYISMVLKGSIESAFSNTSRLSAFRAQGKGLKSVIGFFWEVCRLNRWKIYPILTLTSGSS